MRISSSNLSKILLSSILTMSIGFSLGVNADDSEQIKSSLMSRMTSATGSFISSGIGAIVFLYKRIEKKNHQLSLLNVTGQPFKLMNLLRVDKTIPFIDSI